MGTMTHNILLTRFQAFSIASDFDPKLMPKIQNQITMGKVCIVIQSLLSRRPNHHGSLGELMVEHIHRNRYKHVRHPQVHFVGQTISSWRLVETDLLQRITDFVFSNHTLATSRFSHPKAGEVGEIAAKLLKQEIRTAGKAKAIAAWGLDGIDILLHFFRTSSSRPVAFVFTASLRTLLNLDLTVCPL